MTNSLNKIDTGPLSTEKFEAVSHLATEAGPRVGILMMEGWIKLYRKIRENWIWQDPIKFQWWIDILLEVNHTPGKIAIGFDVITCEQGQSIRSLQGWAKRWGVSKDTARNFLIMLEKDGMILHESLKKTTRITVCNYVSYQVELHVKQTNGKRKANAEQTTSDPNKNDKKEKKEKKLGKKQQPPLCESDLTDELRAENKAAFDLAFTLLNSCPNVMSMQYPISLQQLKDVIKQWNFNNVFRVIKSMENKGIDYLEKHNCHYTFLTIDSWLNSDKKKGLLDVR